MNESSMSLPADYHSHTRLCKHAGGEPVEYARRAAALGIPELAATDHGPTALGHDPEHRMELAEFPEYIRMIETARAQFGDRVLFGVEADYFDGCEAFLRPWLAEPPFDLVLGSIHYLEPRTPDRPPGPVLWDVADQATVWKYYFELVGRLADTGLYDIVGHLDMLKRTGSRPRDRDLKEWAFPALDRIARAGMAIELNTSGLRHVIREIYPSPILLAWARERDIPIVFGSDAHAPDQVGYGFEEAVRLARGCGYTHAARFRRRTRTLVPLG